MGRAGGSRQITDAQVRAKHAPGRKVSEALRNRGDGALVVRWGSGDSRWFYFRYSDPQRRQHAIPLKARTLAAARDEAQEYADRAREARGEGKDLRALLDQEAAARRREERARLDAAAEATRAAERGGLRAMLDGYVAYLQRAGKQAAGDARRLFERHVFDADAFPELEMRQAAAITADEIAAIVRRVVDRGHGRTAAKLRSYLRSAYALAIRARLDASAPAALVTMGVTQNPAAATAALSEFNTARDRVLTDGELGHYASALDALAASPARDALLLALLLGGQRPTQLLRCARGDADLAARTITLRDGKGRRQVPRLHVLPLGPKALAIVEGRGEGASDAPLFSADGKRATRIETCEEVASGIFAAIASDERLRRAKALGAGKVQLRDVRRTCETMLASRGVSRDVCAQILSHGLGGVQMRHYNRHAYMAEKSTALAAWEARVYALAQRHRDQAATPLPAMPATSAANVVELGSARARRGRS